MKRIRRVAVCVAIFSAACGGEVGPAFGEQTARSGRASAVGSSGPVLLSDDFSSGVIGDQWVHFTQGWNWSVVNGMACETGSALPLQSVQSFSGPVSMFVDLGPNNLDLPGVDFAGGVGISPRGYVSADLSTQVVYAGTVEKIGGALVGRLIQFQLVDNVTIVNDRQAVPLAAMPSRLGVTIDLQEIRLIIDGSIAMTVPRLGISISNDSSPVIVADVDDGQVHGCFDSVLLTESIDGFCPCDAALNHGSYVSCVARLTSEWVKRNAITQDTRTAFVTAAAQGSCGK
jgi:hypothetical protein